MILYRTFLGPPVLLFSTTGPSKHHKESHQREANAMVELCQMVHTSRAFWAAPVPPISSSMSNRLLTQKYTLQTTINQEPARGQWGPICFLRSTQDVTGCRIGTRSPTRLCNSNEENGRLFDVLILGASSSSLPLR